MGNQTTGIRQIDLARQLGVSRSYVSRVMSGQKRPSKRMARKLKKVNKQVSVESSDGLKIRWAPALAGSNPALGTSNN
jgi:transcriptional regulator with XRE-family HTH domain